MVFAFCKYYKVKPIAKEDLPDLKDTLKTSWQGLLLPIIILLPFVFDFIFKETLFTQRLGASGAKYFSSSMLFFVAGIAAFYTVLVAKNKKDVSPNQIAKLFGNKIKSISPAIGTCLFGYMIGSLFKDLNVAEGLKMGITALNMGKVGLAFIIPLFTCFMGMVIPGSSLVVMFGSVFISLFAVIILGITLIIINHFICCFFRYFLKIVFKNC